MQYADFPPPVLWTRSKGLGWVMPFIIINIWGIMRCRKGLGWMLKRSSMVDFMAWTIVVCITEDDGDKGKAFWRSDIAFNEVCNLVSIISLLITSINNERNCQIAITTQKWPEIRGSYTELCFVRCTLFLIWDSCEFYFGLCAALCIAPARG